jgi:hypothetical protein
MINCATMGRLRLVLIAVCCIVGAQRAQCFAQSGKSTDGSTPGLSPNLQIAQDGESLTTGIEGHTFLTPEQMQDGAGPSLFEKLSRERRWDSDMLRVLEENLALLQLQAPQHKRPAPVPTVDEATFNREAKSIDNQISLDREISEDANRPEDQRARAQLELIDLTRHEAQLQILHESGIDYSRQKKEDDDFNGRLSMTRAEYVAAQHYLSTIDDAIEKALASSRADNRFRLIMGGAFTFLVACLIFGFFFVALRGEGPRRTFLMQDRGLQFITLFSLVIAIVLFGVMNILEGRELSALLGGLSGYILGRSNLGEGAHPPPPPHPTDPDTQPGTPDAQPAGPGT